MTAGAGALFALIRAIADRPPSEDAQTPDPFLQSVIAEQMIDRCLEMEELMARVRALGAEPPDDIAEILETAAVNKQQAHEIRGAAEERIARMSAGSRSVVDGIERLEAYGNRAVWKANRFYAAIRNWEPPLNQVSREQLLPLLSRMVAEASATGVEPPEDVLAIVRRVEDDS